MSVSKLISTGHPAMRKLIRYLRDSGLMPEDCLRFKLVIAVGEAITVTCERHVHSAEIERLVQWIETEGLEN